MKCALCDDDITPPDESDAVAYTTPEGFEYRMHERCWDRLGLEYVDPTVVDAALVYVDAMRQSTFFEAVDVVVSAYGASERTIAREAMLLRLAVCYGRDGGRNDA